MAPIDADDVRQSVDDVDDDAASLSSHVTFRPPYSPYDLPDDFVPLYAGRTPNNLTRTVGNTYNSSASSRKSRRSSFALSDIFEDDEVEIEILPPDAPGQRKTLRRSKSWQTLQATITWIVKRLKTPQEGH